MTNAVNDEQPLPPVEAVAKLEKAMLDLARAVGSDRPPHITDVRCVNFADGVANLLVRYDVEAECGPIWSAVNVQLGNLPLDAILARLERFVPRQAWEALH